MARKTRLAGEQVLELWLSPEHTENMPVINGRIRVHASQEANALFSLLSLGLADERIDQLAQNLMSWQWPDGGWNCDMKPEATHSSFWESLIPLRALALYGRERRSERALEAARRAADELLADADAIRDGAAIGGVGGGVGEGMARLALAEEEAARVAARSTRGAPAGGTRAPGEPEPDEAAALRGRQAPAAVGAVEAGKAGEGYLKPEAAPGAEKTVREEKEEEKKPEGKQRAADPEGAAERIVILRVVILPVGAKDAAPEPAEEP